MKLDSLVKPTTTKMEVLLDNEPTGVFITGHTPDSAEWRKAQRKVYGAPKGTNIRIGKRGENNTVQVPADPDAYGKRIQLLASVVTNIEGIDGWVYSPEAVLELFSNDGCSYIVEQWENHMDNREAFLSGAETPVSDA